MIRSIKIFQSAPWKTGALSLLLTFISILLILSGLAIGTRFLSFNQILSALLASDSQVTSILVWTLRLPRSLAAFTAGAGLALSGYLLQCLTRNPLAGPGLTGVTAGAVTPIVFSFVYLPAISSVYYPLIGMVGGLAAASFTFMIASNGNGNELRLVLGGISVSLFLNATITYIILTSGMQLPSLLFWLSGGLQGRSWAQFFYMVPCVIFTFCGSLLCQRVLNLLLLHQHIAASMGLHVSFWKPFLLVLAVLPVAGIVPIAGPIAFVGLAAPHIARIAGKNNQVRIIILTFFFGGLMVCAADIIARSVAAPQELPVSIITALIGGPIFIYLAQKCPLSNQSGQ
ncbi:FecCD family ABC transporter permease [Brucellaceae bacterium C25G]